MDKSLKDVKVGIDDFHRSGWEEAIGSNERNCTYDVGEALLAAARSASKDGDTPKSKVLWLLSDACLMMLNPSSTNEPFKPHVVWNDGSRSALPDDFKESDVELFALIAKETDDVFLRSRMADLVWLLAKPRRPEYALLAIDAYRQIPLTTETWIKRGVDSWERAISLTLTMRESAGERLTQIEFLLIFTFNNLPSGNETLLLGLSELLLKQRLARGKELELAERMEILDRILDTEDNTYQAREFYTGAEKWYKKVKNISKQVEMTVSATETLVKEAVGKSSMVAASLYEKAIQAYRSIPGSERAKYSVNNRIVDLHKKLSKAGELALGEMSSIESPSIDISRHIEGAINAVSGKTSLNALYNLANIDPGASFDQTRETAEKMIGSSILSLFGITTMSDDGRVVAKRPGIDLHSHDSEDSQQNLRAQMISNYTIGIRIVVQGLILPAWRQLNLEHRLVETDFLYIANRSPIIPVGRQGLFAKALFAGFEGDFATSLHFLVPQVEHLVRWHLKNAGIKTTNLDRNGIENENGLSSLMEIEETAQIFGSDLSFEIQELFCDPHGPNLRNKLAHGLISENESYSGASIYAWWFLLKLVFNPFWNAMRVTSTEETPSD